MSAVGASALVPFLRRELTQASFTDMTSRGQYYCTLMWVVHQLCTPELATAISHTATGSEARSGLGFLAAADHRTVYGKDKSISTLSAPPCVRRSCRLRNKLPLGAWAGLH